MTTRSSRRSTCNGALILRCRSCCNIGLCLRRLCPFPGRAFGTMLACRYASSLGAVDSAFWAERKRVPPASTAQPSGARAGTQPTSPRTEQAALDQANEENTHSLEGAGPIHFRRGCSSYVDTMRVAGGVPLVFFPAHTEPPALRPSVPTPSPLLPLAAKAKAGRGIGRWRMCSCPGPPKEQFLALAPMRSRRSQKGQDPRKRRVLDVPGRPQASVFAVLYL